DQRMGPLKKLFSNMKDAFAYFGPAALMQRPKAKQTSINDRAMIRSDMMTDHPTLQFLTGAWSASLNRDS
ncbi:MAG: hypothetical protein HOO98_08125, partial [Nitrospira sp.]|nr:hypothetical protein [Nitrospira sp.]